MQRGDRVRSGVPGDQLGGTVTEVDGQATIANPAWPHQPIIVRGIFVRWDTPRTDPLCTPVDKAGDQ